MANSLMRYTQNMSPMSPEQLAQQGGMNMPQMINQIRRFKGAFKGNAKQQVMQMVQNGMRSNEQLEQAMQMARQMQGLF